MAGFLLAIIFDFYFIYFFPKTDQNDQRQRKLKRKNKRFWREAHSIVSRLINFIFWQSCNLKKKNISNLDFCFASNRVYIHLVEYTIHLNAFNIINEKKMKKNKHIYNSVNDLWSIGISTFVCQTWTQKANKIIICRAQR